MPPRETEAYRAAAAAAAQRAASCRRRSEALARAQSVSANDVASASDALAEAVRRAARARFSMLAARARHQALGEVLRLRDRRDAVRDSSGDALDVHQWLKERDVALDELFTTYLTVGGTCSELEIDAFVHGALSIPDAEQTALRHAMWEMDSF